MSFEGSSSVYRFIFLFFFLRSSYAGPCGKKERKKERNRLQQEEMMKEDSEKWTEGGGGKKSTKHFYDWAENDELTEMIVAFAV